MGGSSRRCCSLDLVVVDLMVAVVSNLFICTKSLGAQPSRLKRKPTRLRRRRKDRGRKRRTGGCVLNLAAVFTLPLAAVDPSKPSFWVPGSLVRIPHSLPEEDDDQQEQERGLRNAREIERRLLTRSLRGTLRLVPPSEGSSASRFACSYKIVHLFCENLCIQERSQPQSKARELIFVLEIRLGSEF